MRAIQQAADAELRRRIDALVCGELAEAARTELLIWLDADPTRWRICGLAFLESQMWGEALQDTGSTCQDRKAEEPPPRSKPEKTASAFRQGARAWLAPFLVVAASIAAFVCGVTVQQIRHSQRQAVPPIARAESPADDAPAAATPLVATVPVKSGPLGHIEAALQLPVRTVDSVPGQALSSVPESVRRHWERRGYELVEERRYLPARLPDGRQVMVPVNEVKMKFVGKPVS